MADNKSADRLSFINTLVFTIVASIFSLGLLVMVFFKFAKDYLVFIISVEVGIMIIIFYCIYKIFKNERDIKKVKDANLFLVNFDECADYFVRKADDSGKFYCSNDYVVTDETNRQFHMKIYPVTTHNTNVTIPTFNNNTARRTSNMPYTNRYEEFPLAELVTASNLPTYNKKCEPLYVSNPEYPEYKHLPWTYVKSRCESFFA
jgi:hypothetical protein